MIESSASPTPKPLSDQIMILMEGVHKWYGAFHVLKDINLTVHKSERIVVCGPSGSGKSTAIRCINRLEEYQRGRIVVDGQELSNDVKLIEHVFYCDKCLSKWATTLLSPESVGR